VYEDKSPVCGRSGKHAEGAGQEAEGAGDIVQGVAVESEVKETVRVGGADGVAEAEAATDEEGKFTVALLETVDAAEVLP
jgi:hypothetical protein